MAYRFSITQAVDVTPHKTRGPLKQIVGVLYSKNLLFLLAYLKFVSKISNSLQQSIRLLELNPFERRDLQTLLRGDPPEHAVSTLQAKLQFS